MNPEGRLGHFWQEYFRWEFWETLDDLKMKMEEILDGEQRYPPSVEFKLGKYIAPEDFEWVISESRQRLEDFEAIIGKLKWLMR